MRRRLAAAATALLLAAGAAGCAPRGPGDAPAAGGDGGPAHDPAPLGIPSLELFTAAGPDAEAWAELADLARARITAQLDGTAQLDRTAQLDGTAPLDRTAPPEGAPLPAPGDVPPPEPESLDSAVGTVELVAAATLAEVDGTLVSRTTASALAADGHGWRIDQQLIVADCTSDGAVTATLTGGAFLGFAEDGGPISVDVLTTGHFALREPGTVEVELLSGHLSVARIGDDGAAVTERTSARVEPGTAATVPGALADLVRTAVRDDALIVDDVDGTALDAGQRSAMLWTAAFTDDVGAVLELARATPRPECGA